MFLQFDSTNVCLLGYLNLKYFSTRIRSAIFLGMNFLQGLLFLRKSTMAATDRFSHNTESLLEK